MVKLSKVSSEKESGIKETPKEGFFKECITKFLKYSKLQVLKSKYVVQIYLSQTPSQNSNQYLSFQRCLAKSVDFNYVCTESKQGNF